MRTNFNMDHFNTVHEFNGMCQAELPQKLSLTPLFSYFNLQIYRSYFSFRNSIHCNLALCACIIHSEIVTAKIWGGCVQVNFNGANVWFNV